MTRDVQFDQLKFRDPVRARALSDALHERIARMGREVSLMHVCGSHEQAIARFGLRSALPRALDITMGPGCPVCITDVPEVDEAVALAMQGVRVATYGDMLRVPGTVKSLADAQADGGTVDIVYSISQAVELARSTKDEVVFFATGFETTAVATAAELLRDDLAPNFSVLSVHKYIPPAMEIVAQIPESRVEGFIAAGHACSVTGCGIYEPFAKRYGLPVVVAGFEPLDILAALLKLVELVDEKRPEVVNMYPRCVTREGNLPAMEALFKVFKPASGMWRGIAEIPDGNLRLREEFAHRDARRRFDIDLTRVWDYAPHELTKQCQCGSIMAGLSTPTDCPLYGKQCTPESPVGACMVSSEGTCKIWQQYGGRPDLREVRT